MAIFANVVKEGSFAAAARKLDIPKSTVSKRILELEDRLGTRLLHRTTRRLKLTEPGAAYYEHCLRIVQEAEQADRAMTESGEALRGTMRVTAPWLIGDILEPVMEQFLATHPSVSLDLWLIDRRVDLVAEGVDLAIRAGALPDSSLVTRRLGDVEHRVCASARYLNGRSPIKVPADLGDHDGIRLRDARDMPWRFERRNKKVAVTVPTRYAVSLLRHARDACLAGLGIVHIPQFIVEDDLQAGRLIQLLPDWTIGRGSVQLVYPSSRNLSLRVRALVDLLVATFGAEPPWSPRPASAQRRKK